MQVQKINGQMSKVNNQPSFGISFKTTPEFRKSVVASNLGNQVVDVFKKAKTAHEGFDKEVLIDAQTMSTNLGKIFGTLTQHHNNGEINPNRLATEIEITVEYSKSLLELENHVNELNKTHKINMQFEEGTLKSPGSTTLFIGSIKENLTNEAESLSKIKDKKDYVLKIGFDEDSYGIHGKLFDKKNKQHKGEYFAISRKGDDSKGLSKALYGIEEKRNAAKQKAIEAKRIKKNLSTFENQMKEFE